jgi:hydrophobic/amphiphilic exporter-1 (mainly G- bacteria), HAE1 family
MVLRAGRHESSACRGERNLTPMGRLANLSLRNRALIALVTLFVMIFGVITARQLKQELIPSLTIPTAVVLTTYTGASPQVVEERVTVPIEQAVLGLSGLESSSSTSSTGSSTVIVNMQYGTNMSVVQQDLQAAISRIEGILPDEADSQVITGSLDDFPVLQLSVANDRNPGELAARLKTTAIPELEKLSGVRAVTLAGEPEPRVEIDLDLDKLSDAGLSSAEVTQALQSSGALISAGSLIEGRRDLSVTVGKRLTSADDVADLPLISPRTGEEITIGEVAKVRSTNAPATSIARTNGQQSLSLSITKTPDGNTVEVSEAVRNALPELGDKIGDNTTFTVVFDQAPFITQSIEDLSTEGGLGLVMAILVILVFLQSVRSTLVTAISILVSVLITMIGLRVGDYSLNILTLGALTIAIGRVVDDSIVVIENIKRHLSYGEEKLPAIRTAVGEVATAITAATMTTVAVFLPIALVGGQVGELFRPFAVTVGLALLASLLVSLTIVPVLAYWFLPSPPGNVDSAEVRKRAELKERRNWLQRGYVPLVSKAVAHPVISLLVAVLILGGTVALAPRLETNFLGSSGQNTMTVRQKFEPSLSLKTKSERASRVENAIRWVTGVVTVQSTVGSSGGPQAAFGGTSNDSAIFSVTTDADADQAMIETRVREALGELGGVGEVTVSSADGGFATNEVEVIITTADLDRLATATDAVYAEMKTVDGVKDVTSSLASDQPIISVTVDRDEAAKAGLTDQQVSAGIKGLLAPEAIGSIEVGGDTRDVVIKIDDPPVGVEELKKIEITGKSGPVKLSQVANVTAENVATEVARTDGQRSATVSLLPEGENLGAVTTAVTAALDNVSLPPGVEATVGGASEDQREAFSQLGLALIVAIAIVYVIMVATFKSLLQPGILLVSVPFAATGALAALLISDTPLGVPALIGVLMLVGIVVTNAIVLIDLVNRYRLAGQGIDDALINGARQRLRPILMTALATIMALTPMALGITGGGVFISQPLAIVVIGGLISSTLLTLVLVPVLYAIIERAKERGATRRARRDHVRHPRHGLT